MIHNLQPSGRAAAKEVVPADIHKLRHKIGCINYCNTFGGQQDGQRLGRLTKSYCTKYNN
jgi:hypothetical protein